MGAPFLSFFIFYYKANADDLQGKCGEKRKSAEAEALPIFSYDIALFIFLILGCLLNDDLGGAGGGGGRGHTRFFIFAQMMAFFGVIDEVAFKFDIRAEGMSADGFIESGYGGVCLSLVISAEQVIGEKHAMRGRAFFEDGRKKLHHMIKVVHAVRIEVRHKLEIQHLRDDGGAIQRDLHHGVIEKMGGDFFGAIKLVQIQRALHGGKPLPNGERIIKILCGRHAEKRVGHFLGTEAFGVQRNVLQLIPKRCFCGETVLGVVRICAVVHCLFAALRYGVDEIQHKPDPSCHEAEELERHVHLYGECHDDKDKGNNAAEQNASEIIEHEGIVSALIRRRRHETLPERAWHGALFEMQNAVFANQHEAEDAKREKTVSREQTKDEMSELMEKCIHYNGDKDRRRCDHERDDGDLVCAKGEIQKRVCHGIAEGEIKGKSQGTE